MPSAFTGRRLLLAALSSILAASASQVQKASVLCTSVKSCQIESWEAGDNWTARVVFNSSGNQTGWSTLFVETNKRVVDDNLTAFAAGYIEGALTPELIYEMYLSFASVQSQIPSKKARQFITENTAFVEKQVAAATTTEGAAYWQRVWLLYMQLDGLTSGYNSVAGKKGLPTLSRDQLMWVQLQVETSDIEIAVDAGRRPNFDKMSNIEFQDYVLKHSRCSAFFGVTPTLDDMFSAHVTWSSYVCMLRMFKTYQFHFTSSAAETVIFSGYPGTLISIDDFYISSKRLVVIETSNNVFNNSLYNFVTPQTVPYWVRVMVATRTARDAKEWHDTFYIRNSGTYNNQWMVADYKKFEAGKPLPSGTFYVSEQLPGPYYHPGEDQTMVLQRGHWPSYNVPFYKDVYDVSGYPAQVRKHGDTVGYELAPRAPIFRRDSVRVSSLSDLQHFMRENDYGTGDPLAPTPMYAIASRGDLLKTGASAFGAIDAKVTSAKLVADLAVSAVSGPTNQDQPIFAWAPQWTDVAHYGMPEKFDFDFERFSPTSMAGIEEHNQVGSELVV